jgi:hypothetical protein
VSLCIWLFQFLNRDTSRWLWLWIISALGVFYLHFTKKTNMSQQPAHVFKISSIVSDWTLPTTSPTCFSQQPCLRERGKGQFFTGMPPDYNYSTVGKTNRTGPWHFSILLCTNTKEHLYLPAQYTRTEEIILSPGGYLQQQWDPHGNQALLHSLLSRHSRD